MFGSGVLDTAIGLIFVFLLVSLLVTIVNEMIAAILLSRAKWLRIGIERMLGAAWAERLYDHPLIEGSGAKDGAAAAGTGVRGSGPSYIASRSFANVLLDLIREGDRTLADTRRALQDALDAASAASASTDDLKRAIAAVIMPRQPIDNAMSPVAIAEQVNRDLMGLLRRVPPGYAVGDAATAVQRFIDGMPARYLRDVVERLPEERIRRTLIVLLDDAEGDVERFKQNVEIWFNNAMDRVGGWYKRRSQLVIGIVAVFCVVTLNIDTLLVVNHLETHPGLRDALVAQATAYAGTNRAAPAVAAPGDGDPTGTGTDPSGRGAERFASVATQLSQLGMPIGWVLESPTATDVQNRLAWPGEHGVFDTIRFHLLGWLITGIAATLGAPFWFDMLNRAISIRSAGKSPEEQPKAPRTVPAPLEPGQSPAEADAVAALKSR